MKDHHLDQILICSIYTVLKTVDRQVSFTTILQHYTSQPQARTVIYHQVPISMINTLLHNPAMNVVFNISPQTDTIKVSLNSHPIFTDRPLNPKENIGTFEQERNKIFYIVSDELKDKMLEALTEKQREVMKDCNGDIIRFYNKVIDKLYILICLDLYSCCSSVF